MANVQRKLVHKQFNSPIGLYSDQNVKETLDRELKAFNGNVGIDLNDIPRATFNILNSSVAKMVAEEDYEKTHPGYKRVAWPPVDTAPVYATVPQPQNPPPSSYESSQNEYRPQATQAFQPVNHEPSGQIYQTQNYNNYQPQQKQPQQQQPQQQQYYTQPQQQRQASPYVRGQSPGVIQLRKEAPVSQKPAPVYTSQPAATTLRGGSNMRGDLKWPPPEYKAQAAEENEERRRIALGPVCRPRRINKDYSQFFAKNALNHYYPGYKIPPGTQHMYTQY